jgi:hypothetical protein
VLLAKIQISRILAKRAIIGLIFFDNGKNLDFAGFLELGSRKRSPI